MSRKAILLRSLGVAVTTALVAAGPALAAVPAGSSSSPSPPPTCTAPVLSQIFSWAQDTNWYAAIPGEAWDSLTSKGWTLSGGAKFVLTTLADGHKGTVLDLPSGSSALTPTMCVTNDYPFGRGQIRNISGTSGVNVSVSYMGAKGFGPSQPSGSLVGINSGWTLPAAFNVKPSTATGWQYAQFALTAVGNQSEYQISNLYIDPRMHH